MTDQHLDDERLTVDLQRRADGARHSPDWARRELLPSISAAIDTRPQRVATSRGRAFASLAGVVAILLVLVVALPRLVPGPAASNQPVALRATQSPATPTPTTPSPGPILPEIMSAQEFAVEVLTGRIRASTVLVDGTIGSIGPEAPICPVGGPPCLMGRLERTDPAVDVHARWLPAEEDESQILRQVDGRWPWWHLPAGPITGTLLLAVYSDGVIEFLGRVDAAIGADPLTVAEAGTINVESLALDDVILVDGWLAARFGLPPSCPQPNNHISGLQMRGCEDTWLTDQDEATAAGEGALVVQDGAYFDFAPQATPRGPSTPDPRRAVYVLAPRLEGGGCPSDVTPCWQWEVVGRLSEAPVDPDPTTPPTTTFTCGPTQPPDPHANMPSATWSGFALDDQTDLVERCEAWEFQPADAARMTVTNPNGDLKVLELTWAEACASYANVTFNQLLSGFEIVATSTMPDNAACDGVVFARGLRLYLKEPVAADTVSARVIFTPAVTPTPVATPQIAPEPIACSEEDIHATVYDATGLIQACETVRPTGGAESTTISNPEGDLRVLQVNWGNLRCDIDASFRLTSTANGFVLEERPGTHPRLEDGTLVCVAVAERHAIQLKLAADIDADDVTHRYAPVESPAPPDLGPAWWELAPAERPTDASTELDLVVFERACASGDSPEGRVVGPEIEYGDLAVTITFQIRPLAGAGDCPSAPGAPLTVELSEPLGDRRLVDGGFASTDRVIQHGDGLLWVLPLRSLDTATARLGGLLGPSACPETMTDPRAVDEAQLVQLANDLGTAQGMLGDGLAWVGDAESAVRALGGFELYQDRDRAWYIIAVAENQEWLADGVEAGDLVLADVTSLPISDGRTIWIPGRYHQTFGSADCQWDSGATPAAGPRADHQGLDFTVSISAPSASWTVGQVPEGLGAVLEYSGGRDPIEIVGSGSGIAFAYATRLDGAPRTPPLAVTADCKPYELASGELLDVPVYPAPGISQNGELTLPPGIWRLTAFTSFTIEECGGQEVVLSASIIVRVR